MSDEFELYLLFHTNPGDFITKLSEAGSEGNEDIIIALEKLVKNRKLVQDNEKCFEAIWNLVQKDKSDNKRLEFVFQEILNIEKIDNVKKWINDNEVDVNPLIFFRIARIVTNKCIGISSNNNFFKDLSIKIIEYLYHEGSAPTEAVVSIRSMMVNEDVQSSIFAEVARRSLERNDPLSLQNLCYFFADICQHDCIPDLSKILVKYFEGSVLMARRQGLFLIKMLIEFKKFSHQDEESFKKFVIIVESFEDSQHLISPTLELIKSLNFSKEFANFWFILCRMSIQHESSIVKHWGLSYLLKTRPAVPFDRQQTKTILDAINSASLFDFDETIYDESFNQFVSDNIKSVLANMLNVNWSPLAVYRMLEAIADCITLPKYKDVDDNLLEILKKQTEVLPNRIIKRGIRAAVQIKYSSIAAKLVENQGIEAVMPIIFNIFKIANHHKELESCFKLTNQEDVKIILENYKDEESFVKFILLATSQNSSVREIQDKCRFTKDPDYFVMFTTCEPKNVNPVDLRVLILEKLETLSKAIQDDDCEQVARTLRILNLGLQAFDSEDIFKSSEIDLKHELVLGKDNSPFYWPCFKILLQLGTIEPEVIREKLFLQPPTFNVLDCQDQTLRWLGSDDDARDSLKFLSNIDAVLDNCNEKDQISSILNFVEKILTNGNEKIFNNVDSFQVLASMIDNLRGVILSHDDKQELAQNFCAILWKSANDNSDSSDFLDLVTDNIEMVIKKISKNDKLKFVQLIIDSSRNSKIYDNDNTLKEYVKDILIEQVTETEIMTRQELIEIQVGHQIEISSMTALNVFTISDRKNLRLKAAQLLAEKYHNEYPNIIDAVMEDFSRESLKKPRYFPNAWVHRMKLHYLQAILFSSSLSRQTIEILIHELLTINNQLNVTYLIEIILTRHHPEIINILQDDKHLAKLKSPAIKSILVIAMMQLKASQVSKVLDFEKIHDLIMPFTMGQNYAVRSYARAAMLILARHAQQLPRNSDDSEKFFIKIESSSAIIAESMRLKNSAIFYNALKEDFRFAMDFKDIWNIDIFYNLIPSVTEMTFDEIVILDDGFEESKFYKKIDPATFKIAELQNDVEAQTFTDEVLIPEMSASVPALTNIQQKYLPYKYQIPGADLMKIYPSTFGTPDGLQLELKKRSELIVVASLISKAPNLGGLARTCEIFGVENFFVSSLKLTENSEFKALSKTAEKWMKISEVKSWKLFEFLLGMKLQGYAIVGAEQCEKSVQLVEAKIPKKSVLLLGNEKSGIPADLLSLLDLTIEIPQAGIVRSLNVHVSGAIVIWEYFHQHFID